ncbi:hypothetical protein [Catenulispora rubra]|uniref:hypothetical protein n=1 Tax=Catenulispora rubra TaxID=280293 RepID=UPI0018928550|nr:hypothetical protein [Catenulispora rubra]
MKLRGAAAAKRRLSDMQRQLYEFRRNLGVSQMDTAKLLGVAGRTLRDWEKCRDSPSQPHLISWGYAFGHRLALTDEDYDPELRMSVVLKNDESFVLHETRRLVVPLWNRRKDRRLSQTDFARLLGASRGSVQRWEEDGSCQPIVMIAWAQRLDFSIELRHVAEKPGLWLGNSRGDCSVA